MEIVLGLALNIGLPLAIIYVMHRWIGSYPEEYKKSIEPRREIAEVAIIWFIAMAAMSVFVLSQDLADLLEPSVPVILSFVGWLIVPMLILPIVIVWRQGWRAAELGFRRPTSKWMVVFALALFAIPGVLKALGDSEPVAWSFLAIAVYQPAFIEEFFFRVILQGKLERVVGPTRAWFWSGILFGLAHAPTVFFGPQFLALDESYINASFQLVTIIIAGWIFGLVYAKTRSIFPGMIAHFFTDGRLGSVIRNLIPG